MKQECLIDVNDLKRERDICILESKEAKEIKNNLKKQFLEEEK